MERLQFVRTHLRSNEELPVVSKPNKPNQKQQRSSKCFVYILTGIVLLSTATLVFALVALRVESLGVELSSVALKSLDYVTSPLPSVNATMVAEISVKNKNFGGFNFEKNKVVVLYDNVTAAGVKINGGRARARDTERLKVILPVRLNAFSLTANRNFGSDVNSGLLELRSYAEFSGRVRVMKIIKKHQSAEMNCTMSLNLTTKAIQDLRCL